MPPVLVQEYCRNSPHDVLHAGDRHTVAQGFVTGGIRSPWDVCPPIRETLQTLALKGRQAANQVGTVQDALIVTHILVTDALVIRANQCANRFLVGLHHQIGGILMLPSALRAGNLIFREHVHPLAAVDGVAIHGRQGVGDAFLIAAAVPSILRLTVNDIANDTVNGGILLYQRNIVPSRSAPR